MSLSIHYTLDLQLQGPLLSTAPGAMQVGLDATMQRYQGQPVLNGSLIRGNIRHALQGFAQQLEASQAEALNRSIKRWFGQQSAADLEPRRARVQFDLFWLLRQPQQSPSGSRTRITLDEAGNTQDRHLQVVEDVFGSGSQPRFFGSVRTRFDGTNDSNRIESAVEIPGQVIKAVIAEQYDNDSERLKAELCFDSLGVSFARPVKNDLPLPIPLSLAKLGDTLVDMAGVTDVRQPRWQQTPDFQPDWKSSDSPIENPQRYLLVRTGINVDTGQSAQNQLFALECIDPQGFEWFVDFDLSSIAESQRIGVVNNLQTLLANGLSGIGKTRTHAEVRFRQQPMILPPTLQPWQDDQWLVLLVTPTRMFKPGFTCSGINSEAAISKAYEDYWKTISGGHLRLLNYFAQQQRVGSEYYHRRFQAQQAYQPEWLTVAGSVFVLQSVDVESAGDCLQTWIMSGLPPYDKAGANWRTTPYIAEHGYGEIRVNLAQQLALIKNLKGL